MTRCVALVCMYGLIFARVRSQTCSCINNGGCNLTRLCGTDINCNTINVALGKPATMSTSYVSESETAGPACLAVNGNTESVFRPVNLYPDSPNCVHTAKDDRNPTWQVDLGRIFTITNITVYIREPYAVRMNGLFIYVDQKWCFTFPQDTNNTPVKKDIQCSAPVEGRVVRFYRNNTDNEYFINFCEMEVWVCRVGYYGSDCNRRCGDCMDDNCNPNGNCLSGCKKGWMGDKCTEECISGFYGQNCLVTCGHCAESTCDRFTGVCPNGCESGWKSLYCNQICTPGSYGWNCQRMSGHYLMGSTCDIFTGGCPNDCDSGWQSAYCNQTCDAGYYGLQCSMTCGNCATDSKCETATGACPYGCDTGWQPPFCNQTCALGLYGRGCEGTCGYCKFSSCHHQNGTCSLGCVPGFEGELCKDSTKDVEGQSDLIGPVVGAIIAGFAILTLGVSITLCFRRARNTTQAGTSLDRVLFRCKKQKHGEMFSSTRKEQTSDGTKEYEDIAPTINTYDTLQVSDTSNASVYTTPAHTSSAATTDDGRIYINSNEASDKCDVVVPNDKGDLKE